MRRYNGMDPDPTGRELAITWIGMACMCYGIYFLVSTFKLELSTNINAAQEYKKAFMKECKADNKKQYECDYMFSLMTPRQ